MLTEKETDRILSSFVESLIPQSAKLLLSQNDEADRSFAELDFFPNKFCDETKSNEEEDSGAGLEEPEEDTRESPFSDYGLEVIHEETETSESENDGEDCRDGKFKITKDSTRNENFNGADRTLETLDYPSILVEKEKEPELFMSDPLPKHIKLPVEWSPEPVLSRLYSRDEGKQGSNQSCSSESLICGQVLMLSGSRSKGTYWNAWKKKFCVIRSGRLIAFDDESESTIFAEMLLHGTKVEHIDPVEVVGVAEGRSMVNRVLAVDDGVGHYYVLQLKSTSESTAWATAIQKAANTYQFFVTPVNVRSPVMFKDVLLVDIGSMNIRAGVVAQEPTLPALFMNAIMTSDVETGTVIYGNDAYLLENRASGKIRFPFVLTSKLCQNQLDVEAVSGFVKVICRTLRVVPENFRIILNLPRRLDATCRAKLLQMLFDQFQFRGAIMYHQTLAAFWAHSAPNGIVCDIGERCDIVPSIHGFVMSQAWRSAPLGGCNMKDSLRQGLGPQENGLYLSTPLENLVLRYIAENFTCVASANARRPSQEAEEIIVEMDLRDVLPFTSLIGVSQDVLRNVAEGFFDPGYYGLDCDSVPKLLLKCIQSCELDVRRELSRNIFLTGGCSLIPGFADRLEAELTRLCPPHMQPRILVSPYRYHASYVGSSVLASKDAFEKSLLSKDSYNGGAGPSYWLV